MKAVQCKRRKPYHFQGTGYLAEYVTAIIKELHRGFCQWLHPLIRFSTKRSHIDSFKGGFRQRPMVNKLGRDNQRASPRPRFTLTHVSRVIRTDWMQGGFLCRQTLLTLKLVIYYALRQAVPYHGFARGTPVKILIRFCLIIHQSPPVSPGSYRRQQTWWYRRRCLAAGE